MTTLQEVLAAVPKADSWLRGELATWLGYADGTDPEFDTYIHARTVGMVARLSPDGLRVAQQWGRALTARQNLRIEDTALAYCDQLEDNLRDLFAEDNDIDFEEGGNYHTEVSRLCIDRDGLEGLALILPDPQRLVRALRRLDYEGRITLAAGPHVTPTPDAREWLERTPQLPDEWWTCPVWPEGAHHWWSAH